jgi:RND family efflux transporter MFP subunit
MGTVEFLAGWALRSSILILGGALLLRALRVKDPSVRLAAWTAILCASLALPALTTALPKLPIIVTRTATRTQATPAAGRATPAVAAPRPAVAAEPPATSVPIRFGWPPAILALYACVAFALLLRLCVGLAMTLHLLRSSRSTGRQTVGIEVRESERVRVPVALGIARPAIVLPVDWRQWDRAKLDAVLAHEASHIRRHDVAVQALSAVHRALLWYSPLSWFLHTRIVRAAEEASDDAAMAVTGDRGLYAEVVLEFVQRAVRPPSLPGVNWLSAPMARNSRPDKRIHRILDGTSLSHGLTRWSMAAIFALGSPLAYVASAAHPQSAPQPPAAAAPPALAQPAPAAPAAPARPLRGQPKQPASPQPNATYLAGISGQAIPSSTVTIKPRVDGQLLSVNFKEGEMVQAGQLLATIDPRPYEPAVAQAQAQMVQDQAALANARADLERYRRSAALGEIHQEDLSDPSTKVRQLEAKLQADQANLDQTQIPLSYTKIKSPISGLAGLRLVDPGNVVHASDAGGIVVVTQLQPIAVLFGIAEDNLPQVRARLAEGGSLPVEAWNRTDTAKIATGRLTAVDNQIDPETGTAKLKAEFDNQDGALFPNQFVNIRLFLNPR